MAERLTLARPYARAAFEVAVSEGKLQAWMESMNRLATLTLMPELQELLVSPSLASPQKAELLTAILSELPDSSLGRFIAVLAENKRLLLMPEICELFQLMKAHQENAVDVSVTTAFPVDDELLQQLVTVLSDRLGRQVKIASSVDRSLLGGALIRAGDTVIDGSVRGRLDKLAKAMNA
jgi:F-type H+-transporting ATPase subunit delta